jgi:hypothetical protein
LIWGIHVIEIPPLTTTPVRASAIGAARDTVNSDDLRLIFSSQCRLLAARSENDFPVDFCDLTEAEDRS